MTVKKLITELETKCKSANLEFMGVNLDGVKTKEGLLENVKDEIQIISGIIEYSDIEEEHGMTEREAKGYVTKLKNFVKRHEAE